MKNAIKSPKQTVGDDVLTLDSTNTPAFEKALKTAKSVKAKKEAEAAESATKLKPGIILLQHIPFGFFEKELKGYFSQFGDVLRVRVARSPKTGQSQGYAFIEFEFEDVAKIAAECMDGYLMFERLMKCEVLPPDTNSFKVFSKRHITEKNYPKLKSREMVKKSQKKYQTKEQVKEIVNNRLRGLQKQNKKFAELGIDYSFKPSGVEIEELEASAESKPTKKSSLSKAAASPARMSPKLMKKKAKSPLQLAKPTSPKSPKESKKAKSPKTPQDISPKTPKQLEKPKTPQDNKSPKTPKQIKTPKSPATSASPAPGEKSKTPESIKLPRISPKLLRSRKSLPAFVASPAVSSKTPKRVKDSPLVAEHVTPLSSTANDTPKTKKNKKSKSPKLQMESPPPEKFPKFSPKLLRSKKSDISSLTVAALSSKKVTQKSSKKSEVPKSPQEAPSSAAKQSSPKETKQFPKFSPKLLRSRKSDVSGLQQKKSPGGKNKPADKKQAAGRKSMR